MVRKKEKSKLCQACGRENSPRAKSCSSCNSKRFVPSFIRKIEKINRQFYVQVTDPYEEGDKKKITLYKWWPAKKTSRLVRPKSNVSFHINTAEQWQKIKEIIDYRLSKYVGWKSKKEILKGIESFEKEEKQSKNKIKTLVKNYPKFIRKVLKEIDFSKIKETDYQDIVDIMNELIEIVSETDQSFRIAFRQVIKQLPKQPKRAIEDLSELLKTWSLKQITSISYQVIERLETLKLFKERVLDDKTYEIQGDNSIHRILENAMWIVDERYWLLHSNETLRKIVEKELSKKDRKYKNKRPDFVCGDVGNKLIIIELKRPSHTLKIEDLNQIETYLSIIEEHHKFSSFEAYLVGKRISMELERRIKYRGSQFKIRTFTELIGDTEKRYNEYINLLKK